eukprot:TRINITY_DN30021_c0_g1_i1.p1 TRINITY_DN30021_c0_g1~~TRINITY_DN30021_c0_g1_i1.p1  ORF type:complete len:435 (+),score=112.70 TRINITY_DN30021_c0_g1_i1:63-1307(+)
MEGDVPNEDGGAQRRGGMKRLGRGRRLRPRRASSGKMSTLSKGRSSSSTDQRRMNQLERASALTFLLGISFGGEVNGKNESAGGRLEGSSVRAAKSEPLGGERKRDGMERVDGSMFSSNGLKGLRGLRGVRAVHGKRGRKLSGVNRFDHSSQRVPNEYVLARAVRGLRGPQTFLYVAPGGQVPITRSSLIPFSWERRTQRMEIRVDDTASRQWTWETYDPFYLDDPSIGRYTRRHMFSFPGYISSVVPFVSVKNLRLEWNKQFRIRHSWIDPTMTLSKIRNLKAKLEEADSSLFDVATVAIAHCYFELLVLRKRVTKTNRAVTMAACALLAVKFNESERSKEYLQKVIVELEETFDVPRKRIVEAEASVLMDLDARLFVPPEIVIKVFQRIFEERRWSMREYLGDDMFIKYFVK